MTRWRWRQRASRLVVVLVVTAAGCSHVVAPDQPATVVPVVRLRAEPYSFTFYSGLVEPQRLVVRDPATWSQVWATIWRNQSPTPPLPDHDFARDMLVVVALGQRSTGGYSILIDSAEATSDGVTVLVRAVVPGAGCGVTLALTQPVDIARLPRTDATVKFRDRTVQQFCQ